MTLKEKILYALICFTYITRQALLTMCENPVYGYRVITKLINGGYIKEITRSIKVRGRPRYFTCLRITDKGIAYLRDLHVDNDSLPDEKYEDDQDETGWTQYLPDDIQVNMKSEYLSSVDLYLHIGQSTATMVSLMAGAAVLPLPCNKKSSNTAHLQKYPNDEEDIKPDKLSDEHPGEGETTFAEGIEKMFESATINASHEQNLNGYVFNSQSDLVFYNSKAIKSKLNQTTNKKAQKNYRASRLAGIIQSPLKSVLIYTGRKGGMSWAKWIVYKEAATYRAFTVHHSRYKNKDGGITRGALIVENPHILENIYRDKFGYRKKKESFGETFESVLIIPVSYEGAMCLSEYMYEDMDSFERKFADAAIASGLYVKNDGPRSDVFPIKERETNLPVFIGSYMDGIRLNRLNATHGTNPFDYAILCREWQVEYYQRVTDASAYYTYKME